MTKKSIIILIITIVALPNITWGVIDCGAEKNKLFNLKKLSKITNESLLSCKYQKENIAVNKSRDKKKIGNKNPPKITIFTDFSEQQKLFDYISEKLKRKNKLDYIYLEKTVKSNKSEMCKVKKKLTSNGKIILFFCDMKFAKKITDSKYYLKLKNFKKIELDMDNDDDIITQLKVTKKITFGHINIILNDIHRIKYNGPWKGNDFFGEYKGETPIKLKEDYKLKSNDELLIEYSVFFKNLKDYLKNGGGIKEYLVKVNDTKTNTFTKKQLFVWPNYLGTNLNISGWNCQKRSEYEKIATSLCWKQKQESRSENRQITLEFDFYEAKIDLQFFKSGAIDLENPGKSVPPIVFKLKSSLKVKDFIEKNDLKWLKENHRRKRNPNFISDSVYNDYVLSEIEFSLVGKKGPDENPLITDNKVVKEKDINNICLQNVQSWEGKDRVCPNFHFGLSDLKAKKNVITQFEPIIKLLFKNKNGINRCYAMETTIELRKDQRAISIKQRLDNTILSNQKVESLYFNDLGKIYNNNNYRLKLYENKECTKDISPSNNNVGNLRKGGLKTSNQEYTCQTYGRLLDGENSVTPCTEGMIKEKNNIFYFDIPFASRCNKNVIIVSLARTLASRIYRVPIFRVLSEKAKTAYFNVKFVTWDKVISYSCGEKFKKSIDLKSKFSHDLYDSPDVLFRALFEENNNTNEKNIYFITTDVNIDINGKKFQNLSELQFFGKKIYILTSGKCKLWKKFSDGCYELIENDSSLDSSVLIDKNIGIVKKFLRTLN